MPKWPLLDDPGAFSTGCCSSGVDQIDLAQPNTSEILFVSSAHSSPTKSVATLTDLKNSDFAGIDLLSKLGEPATCYQLRSVNCDDVSTSSAADLKLWLDTDPKQRVDDDSVLSNLTHQQIENTLAYFLLCSERVNQMTKTYNDIDAVAHLLEELMNEYRPGMTLNLSLPLMSCGSMFQKEKDLELAAKIGQTLLEQNRELQQRNEFLEEQLNLSDDQVLQLKVEMQRKVDLLHRIADAECESSLSPAITPNSERKGIDAEKIDGKVKCLEEENANLKLEASHLKKLTQGLEEKEQQLVTDCVLQLESANERIEVLHEELGFKSEECSTQQREVTRLLKEVVTRQTNERKYDVENDNLSMQLHAAQETQAELSREILELQERYAEVVAILTEAQEELRLSRRRPTPYRPESSDSMYESLASELEASDSGFLSTPLVSARGLNDSMDSNSDNQRVARTMKLVRTALQKVDRPVFEIHHETIPEDPASINQSCASIPQLNLADNELSRSPSPQPDVTAFSINTESPISPHDVRKQSTPSGEFVASTPSRLSHAPSTDSLFNYEGPGVGEPGMPGTRDLDFAIRKLNLRRQVERDFQKFRRDRGYIQSPVNPPPLLSAEKPQCDTAKKLSSTTPRVQIFKPLEGSKTLNLWQKLASPTHPSLTGAIATVQSHSGVCTRFDLVRHNSEQSSPEEMDKERESKELSDRSPKHLPPTNATYSIVTSNVKNPNMVTSPSQVKAETTNIAKVLRERTSTGTLLTGALRTPTMSSMLVAPQLKVKSDDVGLQVLRDSGDLPSFESTGSAGIVTRAQLSNVESNENVD